jgi:hypothetical protein
VLELDACVTARLPDERHELNPHVANGSQARAEAIVVVARIPADEPARGLRARLLGGGIDPTARVRRKRDQVAGAPPHGSRGDLERAMGEEAAQRGARRRHLRPLAARPGVDDGRHEVES